MSNFTHYNGDPLYAAAAAILEGKQIETPSELEEGVEEIKKKAEGLKVGDKTNFGAVVSIDSNSITFKAKDLPKTKISFNQRKMGSRDFVLDRLMKLKEDVTEAYKKSPADDYDLEMDNLERDKKIIKKLDKNAITSLLKYYGADASKTKMSAYSGSTTYKAYMNAFDKRAIELGIKEGVELEELLGGDIPQLDEDFIKKVNDALSNR